MKTIFTGIIMLFCSLSFSQNNNTKWIDVNYANDGQSYHNLDIHIPDTQKASYKVIVIIYGSAWFANNMKGMAFDAMGKPLLDAGFAVVSINHRSSTDAKYPAQIHDVKAAIRFIRANAQKYKLDGSFVGISGFSSGGHLASLAGTTNGVTNYTVGDKTINLEGNLGDNLSVSSKVNAVVDWFGPIDLGLMEDCKGPKDEKSPEAAMVGGKPADNQNMIALLSPNTYVDSSDPQFLVIHGDADPVVPYCQSELFAKILKENQILTEFITVPGGQHGPVTFNENSMKKMADFFVTQSQKK
jgi:acetyl esterase/lipase